jgi:putative peptide zinc metalloprotease protein
VILKNPVNGSYFKLSKEGWFIWEQLNGKHTIREVTMLLANQFNLFAPDVVVALISKLAKSGFIQNVEVESDARLASQPKWVRFMLKIRRLLEARISMGDADKWVTHAYKKGMYLFFSPIGKLLFFILSLAGMVAFGFSTHYIIDLFRTVHNAWIMLLLLIPLTIFSVGLHELGHAFATKSYGHEVHYMGVGWYWLSPVAFTDTSDMWLSTRWPRIVVNLAGIFTDIMTASVSALLILVIPNAYVQCLLWLFALYTYINAFRMLSPLQELDGYYVLMDIFDRPHLRQKAVMWLVKGFPKAIREPSLFRKHKAEIWYWISCIIFLMGISLLTLLIQGFVFHILGIKAGNPMVSLALPLIVVIVSSLGIIADIRSQVEE